MDQTNTKAPNHPKYVPTTVLTFLCPLCNAKLEGSPNTSFHCKTCHILFNKDSIKTKVEDVDLPNTNNPLNKINNFDNKHIKDISEKNTFKTPQILPAGPEEILKKNKNFPFFASNKSNRYHKTGCKYVPRIYDENMIHFQEISKIPSNFKPCKCVRKKT